MLLEKSMHHLFFVSNRPSTLVDFGDLNRNDLR